MKILFLSRWFPYPVDNGSKLRIYNLLRGLSQYHDVTLLSFSEQPWSDAEMPEIRKICSKVKVIPWREFNPNTLRTRLAIFDPKPRSIVDTFSSEMATAITTILSEQQYNLIIASQLPMAAYYPYFQNIPAIFEEAEIGLFHDQAFLRDGKIQFRQFLTWFKLRLYLSQLLNSFDACTVVSERERQLLSSNLPKFGKNIEIIPNCLNVDEYKDIAGVKKNNTLIFTGSFKYHANYEAMLWFVHNVFPLVLEQVPDTQLIITGDHGDRSLPFTKNITLAGYVEDIRTLIASCSICIASLLKGGGTRLKILEAMALGTPVVATSKGAEGLDVVNRKHLLIADTPAKFAECIVDLLQNIDLYKQLSKDAALLVEEKYNWGTTMQNYLSLIEALT